MLAVIVWARVAAYAVAAGGATYHYTIDLAHAIEHQVFVSLETPAIKSKEITFYLPKMIPGTYAIEDYGRFLADFKAFDKKGNLLEVVEVGTNGWLIKKATKLVRISYRIEDTYHSSIPGPDIFQPAGTNIEPGKNFILNASGFFGYFEGMRKQKYEVTVMKPASLYGSTGLIPDKINHRIAADFMMDGLRFATTDAYDVYSTPSYDALVDSPIMYSPADTATIDVAGTQVLVGVYSPNAKVNAQQIAGTIDEVLMAQKDYLGGKLPVAKYAFIFYFTDEPVMSYGALEHSYSSFYYMPEETIEQMEQQLRDFAAHEFFHIVTPLTIHSEEIGDFDFTNPKMSRHLWLYEGMTEYFAGNAQIKGKLIDVETYLGMLQEKLMVSSQFIDTVAFTDISLGALGTYEDQYYNVYMKGALIGMCLDITLRELSGGNYGVQQMMADLAKRYGKDKSFKDEELFDVITGLTYPEVGDFLHTYVGGPTPLPYKDYFAKVGVRYVRMDSVLDFSMGLTQQSLGVNFEEGTIFVKDEEMLDAFGKALGLKDNDVIAKINGKEFPKLGSDLQTFVEDVLYSMEEGKPYVVTVLRKNGKGEQTEVDLEANVFKVLRPVPFNLSLMPEATAEQLALRKAWLGL